MPAAATWTTWTYRSDAIARALPGHPVRAAPHSSTSDPALAIQHKAESLGLIVEKYLEKGSKVFVQGKLKNRSWEDGEGITRYATEVHLTPFNGNILFLDSRKDGGEHVEGRAFDRANGAFGRGEEQPAARPAQKPRATRGRGRKAQETVGAGTGFGGGTDLDEDIPF